MHIRPLRHRTINLLQKIQDLFGAVAFVTFSSHGTGGDIA
jgi:hypothetical protein